MKGLITATTWRRAERSEAEPVEEVGNRRFPYDPSFWRDERSDPEKGGGGALARFETNKAKLKQMEAKRGNKNIIPKFGSSKLTFIDSDPDPT